MTVERFLKLIDAGVFTKEDRVFLWHGSLDREDRPQVARTSSPMLGLQALLLTLAFRGYHVELDSAFGTQ